MTAEFGVARAIDAQAFGQPGQRTFRLRIVGEDGATASVWLEKEQTQALSLALKQMLGQLEYKSEPPPADVGEFPVVAEHDFRAGRMGLGFNAEDRTIAVFLYEAALEEEAEPTVRVRLTQEQCGALGERLDEIIAGGRPICPLCGQAIAAGGHMCIRANGHSTQALPEEDQGEESG